MNPLAMTIISPQKKYWPSRGSNQRCPVLKSCTLPLWGLAPIILNDIPCLFFQDFVNLKATQLLIG